MAAPLNPTSFDTRFDPFGNSCDTSFDLRPLRSPRPHLRVIEGGRSDAVLARRRVYRRRRIVAALLAASALFLGVRLAGAAATAMGGADATVLTAAAAPGAPGAAATADAAPAAEVAPVYVVRRGDTLWSIAATLGADAGGDPRALVDALSERTDGRALQPGQRIDLSGLPGLDG